MPYYPISPVLPKKEHFVMFYAHLFVASGNVLVVDANQIELQSDEV